MNLCALEILYNYRKSLENLPVYFYTRLFKINISAKKKTSGGIAQLRSVE